MWFLIALLGYLLLAIVFVMDKIVVSKSEIKPATYTFYSTVFMLGLVVLVPFGIGFLHGMDWLWAAVSGLSFGFALWTIYIAMKHGETSHISPFNGAMLTVFIYVIANLFLSERLTFIQGCGVSILVIASLLLSSEKSRAHHGFHIGFVWALISGLLFAISHSAAKYIYGIYPFWTGFVWTRLFIGVVGLIALCLPSVWQSLKKKKSESKQYAHKHATSIVVVDKVLSVGSVVLLQYAMSIGSVTLVNALGGLQYVFLFMLVYVLTKLFPKIFNEYFTKQEIKVEIIAIVLVAIGSLLFVL